MKKPRISDEVKALIKASQLSRAETARLYGVSPRTVDFIWYPEKLEKCKEQMARRGGWRAYRTPEEYNRAISRLRDIL